MRGNKPFACPSRNELQLVLRSKRAPGLLALSIVLHFAPLRTPTLAIAAENPPPYRWVQVAAKAPFAPRDGAGAFVFDGKMWLAGGWNPADKQAFPRTCSNDVWYSADGVIWTQLPDTPWKPRHAASVFVHDNALWLVAGSNMESDVWKLVRTSAKP